MLQTYKHKQNARRAARSAGLDPDNAVAINEAGAYFLKHAKDDDVDLDLPEALMIPQEERSEEWAKNPPRTAPRICEPKAEDPATAKIREEIDMAKKAKTTARISKLKERHGKTQSPKVPRGSGSDKTATLLAMLKGKGSTVEALTKALGWLPHTLRARLSRLPKDDKKIKIERTRVDGVTSYRTVS